MAKLNITVDSVLLWVQKNPWKVGSLIIGLFALWFALQGVDIYRQNQSLRDAINQRDGIVKQFQAFSASHQDQMPKTAEQFNTEDSLTNKQAIISAFKKSISDAELVEVFDVNLAEAYQDIGKFGAGKLAVLESANQESQVAIRVISVQGQQKIAMAKLLGNETPNILVYVQLPISVLDELMPSTSASDIYLALRQAQVDLLKHGNAEFADTAETNAKAIAGAPWRIVASSKLPEAGLFNMGGVAELSLAVLLLILAFLIALTPAILKKRAGMAGIEEDDHSHLTLHEMQKQGVIKVDELNPAPVFDIKDVAYPKVPLERSIFRAYDIRGVVGTNLDAGIARLIGEVIGTILVEKQLKGIVVGYDGRLSSPALSAGLIEGLIATGSSVLNIGQVPTPAVYFATYHSEFTSGISITGSHNPPDYNGFKIMIDGHTLSGDEIINIYERIAEKRIIKSPTPGHVVNKDIVPEYTQFITNDIQIDRPLKVVIDCGNGVPGGVAPAVIAGIGAKVVETLYCDVDGTFPNHHPDPSDPANLIDLIKIVKLNGADIGLAFDGDGDRLGVVTAQGDIIYPDRLLMLFAEDILRRNPGAAIIYDVKCTGALQGHILRHGGSPIMWKTGHSLIKAKMKETHAEFAGEMSGHFFFAERWFGFDDGIYAAARLLEILAASPDSVQDQFDALPKSFSTPELKVELAEGEQHTFIEKFVVKANFEGARINTIDGIRADWPYGWGLVRASNTTPVLVLRFEADSEQQLTLIKNQFRDQMLAMQADLHLPF
jgi:phosphomannomutase/phosphoglucomutase